MAKGRRAVSIQENIKKEGYLHVYTIMCNTPGITVIGVFSRSYARRFVLYIAKFAGDFCC